MCIIYIFYIVFKVYCEFSEGQSESGYCSGLRCSERLALGQSCSAPGENFRCVAGAYCVSDGVEGAFCCSTPCDAPCELPTCSDTGSCDARSNDVECDVSGDACASNALCDGFCDLGTCVGDRQPRQECSTPAQCAAGQCIDGFCSACVDAKQGFFFVLLMSARKKKLCPKINRVYYIYILYCV